MKKPSCLEITDNDLHWFKPSLKGRRTLLATRIKRGFKAVGKVFAKFFSAFSLTILVSFAYMATIHHPVKEPIKIPTYTLEMQIDRVQAIANERRTTE